MKTTLTLLLSLLLVSSSRGEDYLKDKITPQFNVLESNQVGLMSKVRVVKGRPDARKNPGKLLLCFCVCRILKRASMTPPLGFGQRSQALDSLTLQKQVAG